MNRRWRSTWTAVLPLLLVLVVCVPGCGDAGEGRGAASPEGGEETVVTESLLKPGSPLRRTLTSGQTLEVGLDLAAGTFVRLVAEQHGVDVELRLFAPGSEEPRLVVDTPIGSTGEEVLYDVPEVDGTYRLEIEGVGEEGETGEFLLRLDEPRPPTDRDRRRVEAEQAHVRGHELRRRGQREAALERFERAATVARELEDEALEGRAVLGAGRMAFALGRPRQAAARCEAALEIFRRLGDRDGEAIALNRLARALRQLGREAEVRKHFRAALAIFRQRQDVAGETVVLNNLGNSLLNDGEIQEALEVYRQALELAEQLGDREYRAVVHKNLGDVHVLHGLLQRAEDHYREALTLAGSDLPRQAALSHEGLGRVHHRRGDLKAAVHHLEQALELRRAVGDRRGEAVTLNTLGTAYLKAGEYDAAEARYAAALEIGRELEGRTDAVAAALSNLGRVHYHRREYDEAVRRHEEALEIYRHLGYGPGQASTRFGAARSLHAQGEHRAALDHLEAVLEEVEELRQASFGEDLRTFLLADRHHYWELFVDTLMALHDDRPDAGHAARALEASERWRARGLLDLLAASPAELRLDADPDLLREERELQRRLNALALRQARRGEAADDALRSEQEEVLSRLGAVRADLRRRSPRYAAFRRPELPTARDMAQHLAVPGNVLLAYFLGEERSFVWALRGRKGDGEPQVVARVLPPRGEIETLAEAFHGSVQAASRSERERARRIGARLSEVILAPVAPLLDADRLVVVADGALHQVPFAALPRPEAQEEDGDDRLLIDDLEVVHLPSLAVLESLRSEAMDRMPPPGRVAVVADPVFHPGDPRVAGGDGPFRIPDDLARSALDVGEVRFPRLQSTGDEARALLDLAGGGENLLKVGFEASRELMLSGRLGHYQVVHLATHGLVNLEHPELSGLVLSLVDEEGQPRDGFVRLHEIYNLDLPAELVVLSACRTGVGQRVQGEGVLSLTRAFLHAGTPRVVMSLWSVDDEATALLMEHFYRAFFEDGLAPAAALRRAQLALRESEPFDAPYFWAGFVFQGEWRFGGRGGGGIEKADKGGIETNDPSDTDLPLLPPPLQTAASRAAATSVAVRGRVRELRGGPGGGEGGDSDGGDGDGDGGGGGDRSLAPPAPPLEGPVLHFTGLDATSGQPILPPMTDEQLATLVLGREEEIDRGFLRTLLRWVDGYSLDEDPVRAPVQGVDPKRLDACGWGVVFAEDADPGIRRELDGLLELRREQVGSSDLFREDLVLRKDETRDEFLGRHNVGPGPADPERLPYYLLLVGDPQQIPFRFQYELDVQYAVGRLHFDELRHYRDYARHVVDCEEGRVRRSSTLSLFSVDHDGDAATGQTDRHLIRPLAGALRDTVAQPEQTGGRRWSLRHVPPDEATKERLGTLLADPGASAVLMTAGHGVRFRAGDERQERLQGALVCRDYPGTGYPEEPHYFSAADVDRLSGDLRGALSLHVACFGAGTPRRDNFPRHELLQRGELASRPFVSGLAKAQLRHGVLAVIGHVDRAWDTTFSWAEGASHAAAYESTLHRLLDGHPAGSALEYMNQRYAELGAMLAGLWQDRSDPYLDPPSKSFFGKVWRAYHDARNFVLLGDPAVRPAVGR